MLNFTKDQVPSVHISADILNKKAIGYTFLEQHSSLIPSYKMA